jgi:ABC-type hemin transport system substrate-binding protein
VRVVSLVPSVTETLLAWGVEPVACTRFCEQPRLRHVGGTKDPDVAAITALRPDLVVLNDEENRREDHDALVAGGLDVHVVRVRSVADVPGELDALRVRLHLAPEPLELDVGEPAVRATAFVPIWRRPWMAIGHDTYGASLLRAVGVAVVHEGRYPETTLEAAAALAPEVVLAPSEPYPFAERHREELEAVAPVRFVDGQDLFWWGARTPAALRRLESDLST